MQINEFKNEIFKKALEAGFSKCEIYYRNAKSFSVSVYKGEVEKYQNNSSAGVSFRGEYNGVMGYAYSEKVDFDIIDMLIKNAKENAEIICDDEKEIIYEGDKIYPEIKLFHEDISKVSVEDKIKTALKMEETVLSYDARIKSCNRAVVADSQCETYIANTMGMDINQKSNYIMAYVNAMAEENGQTKTTGEIKVAFDFKDINPVEIGEIAAKKAIDSLGAKSVKSGKHKVIIKNEAFVDLFSSFIGCFNAENVQKGFSLLKGKNGEKIASSIINIVDEPLMEGGYSSTAFDSEGVAAFNKTVVENGVLKTFLYNLKTAQKDGVKSTGNGFKGSFKGSVSIGATNFYIKPMENSIEKLIEEIGEGLLITDFSGLHSGTNGISGDFSLACEGFYIRDGKLAEPVEQITAAGNFFSVLNNIAKLGSDLKFDVSGVGSPSVVINEMDISGI